VLELAIRTAMMKLGAGLLQGLLGLDAGHRGQMIDCGQGHEATFVSYRTKNLDTVLGPVKLRRAWYHCQACRAGLAPRDRELGVGGSSLSPGLRAMLDRVGSQEPFAQARRDLAELAGIELTTKRVERAAEADGGLVAGSIEAEAQAIVKGGTVPLGALKSVDKLYVAVDGTGVPTVPAETQGRAGKANDGRAHTREVKLACVFTQSGLDDEGYAVADPGSSSYVATFEPAEAFGSLVYAEAQKRGSQLARQVIVIGDGAHWIWNLAGLHFPGAIEIVDLYHAREHLHGLGRLLSPALGDDTAGWIAERLDDLDAGDVGALLAATRCLAVPDSAADDVATELGYFQTNAQRMRYAHFRQLGLFVGSGAVEAGCRAVIAQRLKLSGMRWTLRGAGGIATLRCQGASGRWDEVGRRVYIQTGVA
jgi:hypothetical protein